MKIYMDRIVTDTFRRLKLWAPGMIFIRLIGINVTAFDRFDVHVEPVYLPIIRYEAVPGNLVIEVSYDKPLFIIIFSQKKPWIFFQKSTGFVLENIE